VVAAKRPGARSDRPSRAPDEVARRWQAIKPLVLDAAAHLLDG
jgi:hypothetical protein